MTLADTMIDRAPTRRACLRLGSLGILGLTLPGLLRARASSPGKPKDTAVIQIVLTGGLSHVDTYDPKPDAPAEYRGEFRHISSNVSGISLCEMFPKQARIMDRLALVRGMHHRSTDHAGGAHWVMSGFKASDQTPRVNERPSVGSVVARMRGANARGMPAYVAAPEAPPFASSAYLGPGDNPFSLSGQSRVPDLDLASGVTLDRLGDRRTLLRKLDTIERARDGSGTMQGMDRFTDEALAMITGPRARQAFDLARESDAVRDRYGRSRIGQSCLLARRLVEAGVTFVTLHEPGWDHHTQLFTGCRSMLPPLDAGIASLVTDLHERGLAGRVLVVICGEFGRTPRVNGSAGRDHWPGAFTVALAGGGLKMGQVIGASGKLGDAPSERPVRPDELLSTIYEVLGIDPRQTFTDTNGRPRPILDDVQPIRELF